MSHRYPNTDLYRVAFTMPPIVERAVETAHQEMFRHSPDPNFDRYSRSATFRYLIKRGLGYATDDGAFHPPDFGALNDYFPPRDGDSYVPSRRKQVGQVVLRDTDAKKFDRVKARSGLTETQLACYLILMGAKDVMEIG